MTCNFHKANRWCNNHCHKYFAGNQLSKTVPFIGSPQAIIYQLSNRHSTQYIIIVVSKICYTVVICVYLIVPYLFCIKQSLSNLSSFHFQTKHSDTHASTHSWSSNNAYMVTETSKTINFWACFFYNMFLYWIAIPFISIMFLCWQVFSGGLKKLTI